MTVGTPNYVSALIIGVVVDQIDKHVFYSNFDAYLFNVTDYNFRNTFLIPKKLRVLFYDTPPYSYRGLDDKVKGVDGNVIDEFCKRHILSYWITNKQSDPLNVQYANDIILYRRFHSLSAHFVQITLNDLGASQCFLFPRNIPVYNHLFSNPFQKLVSIVFVGTSVFVGIIWKVFKLLKKQDLSLFKLSVSILKIIHGHSIDDGEVSQNRLLLVPFILMCFILTDIFKSFLISTSIIEPPMRSFQSLFELNSSDTKIYEYYEEIKVFSTKKVIHKVPVVLGSTALSKLPDNVDTNLAYVVRCRFGQEFVSSRQNFVNDKQLFNLYDGYSDKQYSSYLVHENFPLKSEIQKIVSSLQESGILDFWTETLIRESFPKHFQNDKENSLSLRALFLPLLILGCGLGVSIVVFLMELISINWKSSKGIDLKKEKLKRERWRKLNQIIQKIRLKH